jgi:acyl carrier protein
MDHQDILRKVNDIFIDVLDNPDIVLTDKTEASDIAEWDSLNHIQLVVAIERAFKLKFTSREIQSWKNVGEMCHALNEKINA